MDMRDVGKLLGFLGDITMLFVGLWCVWHSNYAQAAAMFSLIAACNSMASKEG